jgi:xanthine dehydrogenase molybdenum-binding subunit
MTQELEELSVIGKRVVPRDRIEKVTGAAKFAADIKLPGMLVGKVLRSPYAHANVLSVDASKAEKLPGVKAVITEKDVPKMPSNWSCFQYQLRHPEVEGDILDQRIFDTKVRYVGDAVAAVAAINESIAEEALGLIDVEYEVLPAVFNTTDAMKPDAPRIHDWAERNIMVRIPMPPVGDPEKGFKEADYLIEENFYCSKPKQGQLEPDASIASFDETGRLTVWSSSQLPHQARKRLADLFDIPEGMIRVITPYVGGSFGGRDSLTAEPIAIALAKKSGRPVLYQYTKDEDFIVHESGIPISHHIKAGVKKDGTITALKDELVVDAGPYCTSTVVGSVLAAQHVIRQYRCPNVLLEPTVVYTNRPVTGTYRYFGAAEGVVAGEQIIDMLAEKIGMDAVEFRVKNHQVVGDTIKPGFTVSSCALDECLKLSAEKIGWKEIRGKKIQVGTKRRGVGCANVTHSSSGRLALMELSTAIVKLNEDCSASVITSATEMGQGVIGVMGQIAAEVLGLPFEDIHVVIGDTDVTPWNVGSHASRSTFCTGTAVQKAAQDAREQLLERAAKMLEVSAEELDIKDRRVYVKASPGKGMSLRELARKTIYNFDEPLGIIGRCSWQPDKLGTPWGAFFVEVEVDIETGEVKILKMVFTYDIGRAINPTAVEGQLQGGTYQGVGYGLWEDVILDENGVMLNDSLATYKIPSTLDLPDVEVILVEHGDPNGPFGAKGIGELPRGAPAPAISNAIYDAIGVRIKDLPMTPEKILKALKEKKE